MGNLNTSLTIINLINECQSLILQNLQESKNSIVSVTTISQQINIINGTTGVINCSSLNLSNVIQSKVYDLSQVVTVDSMFTIAVKTLQDQLVNGSQQTKDFLSSKYGNVTVANYILQQLQDNFQYFETNSCSQYTSVSQSINFVNNGVISGNSCDFENNAQVIVILQCYFNSITKLFNNDPVLASASNKIDKKYEQTTNSVSFPYEVIVVFFTVIFVIILVYIFVQMIARKI